MEVASSTAEIQPDTPLLRRYQDHKALHTRMEDRATSSEEYDRLCVVFNEPEDRLAAEPVTCMGDLAVKILALSMLRDEVNSCYDPRLLADCEAVPGVRHD